MIVIFADWMLSLVPPNLISPLHCQFLSAVGLTMADKLESSQMRSHMSFNKHTIFIRIYNLYRSSQWIHAVPDYMSYTLLAVIYMAQKHYL